MMTIPNFRTAAKGFGTYCHAKNELSIRKGKKIYRVTCDNYQLRFVAAGHDEAFPVAPDATVRELKRCIAWLVEKHHRHQPDATANDARFPITSIQSARLPI